jgi:hypothetical protein
MSRITRHTTPRDADPEVRLAHLDPSRHRTDARRSIADRWREASTVAVTRFVIAPVVGPLDCATSFVDRCRHEQRDQAL